MYLPFDTIQSICISLSNHMRHQADARNQTLTEQLERLFKIRESEPERLLKERVEQYEATAEGE